MSPRLHKNRPSQKREAGFFMRKRTCLLYVDSMNDIAKAYIAGIIDGEGTITLVRKHKNEHYSPEVTVANTSLELLLWLQKQVCGGDIRKKNQKTIRHRQAHTWRLRGDAALSLLGVVFPFLLIKNNTLPY